MTGPKMLAASLLVVGGLFAVADGPVERELSPADEPQLLKQRVNALTHLAQRLEAAYAEGKADMTDVIGVKAEVKDAELELVDSPADRVKNRREKVQLMRAAEKLALRQFQIGTTAVGEYERATVSRLTAEIELVREMARAEKPQD